MGLDIVCQVAIGSDQATFTWSEGPAWFEPYRLTGQNFVDLRSQATSARERLCDMVKDYLGGSDEDLRTSCYELARSGYKLYRHIFTPDADQLRIAKEVRTWLDDLHAKRSIDSLEIVIDGPRFLPWNVVYAAKPQSS